MSVSWSVYLREENLPSCEQWQSAIDRHGIPLKLDTFSPREQTGFVPAQFKGTDCGFEYSFGPVDETATNGFPEEIGNRDWVVAFKTHGGREIDCQAAMFAAAVLAELTNGVYEDDGTGIAEGSQVFDLLAAQANEARERRRIEAAKWASITTRRCPECDSPCPEYRKTCKVCGFEVGRVFGHG